MLFNMAKAGSTSKENVKELRRDSRGDQRRRRIFRSLHDCIIEKGYIKTTLADIADGAGMSASHLLYYFKGKEAILEQYFDDVSQAFRHQLNSFSDEVIERQIALLADLWFRNEPTTKSEIGFMFECFGAAVNDASLKKTKAEFDTHCKTFLIKMFEQAPTVFFSDPKDSAEIAYSLMMGLRSAVYFDDDIDLENAHQLFTASIRTMTGITPSGAVS